MDVETARLLEQPACRRKKVQRSDAVTRASNRRQYMKSDTIVIIPTYNESENIRYLVETLLGLEEQVDLLIVDDGSPDGTAGIIEGMMDDYPGRIHMKQRDGKLGLGSAYVEGFRFSLDHGYRYVCEMDADLSHDPYELPKLIRAVKDDEADLVVGSRYYQGISIINWPLSRLILSYSANLYARMITRLPIFDTTSGFKCIKSDVLESINLSRIRSNGYAFQIEVHFRAWHAGFRLKERSIIFRERREGVSKMSRRIVFEAVWMVWVLKFRGVLGLL